MAALPSPRARRAPSLSGSAPEALTAPLEVRGRRLPITLRRHPRARRLSLRLDPAQDTLVLVAPPDVPPQVLQAFVDSKTDWVQRQMAALPDRVPFAAGAVLPLLGRPHVIHHRPQARRGVWLEEGEILVSGQAEHLPRRLNDWLRAEARRVLSERVRQHAAALDQTPGAITIRDPRSRWGSCAAGGRLSFSWRLILAPEAVADYVAAHEVAHLVEFNHSPRFWELVRRLRPDCETQRAWLRDHGLSLHRFG